MKQKKIILVTGATGAQGGSVAKALLAKDDFAVRVLTRNAASAAAHNLRLLGADVVEGNLDGKESLKLAMKDVYGVFGVTNFWEHYQQEFNQGKNLIDAVKEAGVKHFVYSSLPNYKKLSNGELEVPHCDLKGELEEYTKSLGIPFTFIHIAFYYENFFSFFPFKLAEDGRFHFGFPQGYTKLAMVSVEDLGGVVASVFNFPIAYTGRTVGVVGADETCDQYAATLTRILGYPVQYDYIPRDIYASFGFPGAEELANMFEVQRLYIPTRQLDLIESYGLNPAMQSFEHWVTKNKERFVQSFREQLEPAVL